MAGGVGSAGCKSVFQGIFVRGEEAFVTYLCLATDGRSFRNTEFLTFAGGKVRRIDVYFGAARQDGRFLPQPR